MMTHPNGDKCIWLTNADGSSGEWFVPLDAGGEGYTCPHEHPWEKKIKGREALAAFADHDISGVLPYGDISEPWYHRGIRDAQEYAASWLRNFDYSGSPTSYANWCDRLTEEIEDLAWETGMSEEERHILYHARDILIETAKRLKDSDGA
jgi:hypothetical protein